MFEQRLRELRLRRDMSQADLAKALNVSAGTIGNYESGVRKPKDDIFPKLAEYFGVSEEWLRRGALITDKQRKAIMDRFDEPLGWLGSDAETVGINPDEVWQALKSRAPLREDRVIEIASAIGTRIDDILADPALQEESDGLPDDVVQMAQDIYDKNKALFAVMADATPADLAQVEQFINFLKSQR